MDYSLPGSSVHEILQARKLERVVIPFSKGIFLTWGFNPRLLHSKQIFDHLSHLPAKDHGQNKPIMWSWYLLKHTHFVFRSPFVRHSHQLMAIWLWPLLLPPTPSSHGQTQAKGSRWEVQIRGFLGIRGLCVLQEHSVHSEGWQRYRW